MPSKAYTNFLKNAEGIDALVEMYKAFIEVYEDGEIPEEYDVLFRSAVVLMVSNWEAYIEDISSEALQHIVEFSTQASKLPKEIKKIVAKEVKADLNEIAVWDLADEGWKKYLKLRLAKLQLIRNREFQSPKAAHTKNFISDTIGIEDITSAWSFNEMTPQENASKLDKLVSDRGDIAHRGQLGHKLKLSDVEESIEFLRKLVSKTGGRINSHLKKTTGKPLFVNP